MTAKQFRKWLDEKSKWFGKFEPEPPEVREQIQYDAAGIIQEAASLALDHHFPAAYEILKAVRPGPLGIRTARLILSEVYRSLDEPHVPSSPGSLLDIRQVAAHLNIDERSVRRRVSDGSLPEPIKIGRAARWRRSDLEAL